MVHKELLGYLCEYLHMEVQSYSSYRTVPKDQVSVLFHSSLQSQFHLKTECVVQKPVPRWMTLPCWNKTAANTYANTNADGDLFL